MELRISDYSDYLNALPEGWQKANLIKDFEASQVNTEPSDESYFEACERAEAQYESQKYESARASAQE